MRLHASMGAGPAVAPSHSEGRELEALRAEVARLKAENARLRLTPSALLFEVNAAVRTRDVAKAEAGLKQLTEHFPHSPEVAPARKQVQVLLASVQAADEEAKRVAALGFRALKVNPNFTHEGTTLNVTGAGLTRRWVFDAYGNGVGWKYVDAERGQRLLVAKVSVNAKSKDPALFGIGVYQADGAEMKQLGLLRYRFARWSDFGAYLGTHADFGNDFSHSMRIPFSAGAAVPENVTASTAGKPLYLVATREGCHKRLYDRQIQPPVHYYSTACASLKKSLTIDDFKDGSLAVVRRLN